MEQFKTLDKISLKDRGALCSRKISYQFPQNPDGLLHFKVYESAIVDLTTKRATISEKRIAVIFLNKDSRIALNSGIEPEWIRNQVKLAGISLNLDDYQDKREPKRRSRPNAL